MPQAQGRRPAIEAFEERVRAAGKPATVVLATCMRTVRTIPNASTKIGRGWEPRPIPDRRTR